MPVFVRSVSEEWLHTGDLVLLKVYLRDSEGYVEAATNTQDTGYIRGSGMHATLEVEGVDDFHTGTVDVRDFIFVVVEQLSYNAQKDLLKKKKQLYQEGLDPSSACRPPQANPDSPRTANRLRLPPGPVDPGPAVYALQLRSLEERAKMEAVDGDASKGSQLGPRGGVVSWRFRPFTLSQPASDFQEWIHLLTQA
ncbi:unnamed protein product [Symbiodinium sp. CCMP2456]|nr:unnamed protein product [Symbiodinium sp. CCMP2456]